MAYAISLYVIGYPKSGNTWLTRVLAKSLRGTVKKFPQGGDSVDPASAVNSEIDSRNGISIAKAHFLPEYFFAEICAKPTHIVYIERDIRDVIVSAFFYFSGIEDNLRQPFFREHKIPSLSAIYEYIKNRREFQKFIDKFVSHGFPDPRVGNYKKHLRLWNSELEAQTKIPYQIISYESLVHNRTETLASCLQELGLRDLAVDDLQSVFASESIESLQQKAPDMHLQEPSFSQSYYKKFFRKGSPGDWVNYLSEAQVRQISAYMASVEQPDPRTHV